MTKQEIEALDLDALEARAREIADEVQEADETRLAELDSELDAIEERKATIKNQIEQRNKDVQAVIDGMGEEVRTGKAETMTDKEIRSTKKYVDAYVDYIKGKNDGTECRALLTEGANVEGSSGPVPVPTYVENRIETAWENDEILSRVSKSYLKGNIKVGVEMEADPAVWHAEGTDAPAEEKIKLAIVQIFAQTAKKWTTVSTEVMDMNGEVFLDYIYDEIVYQIVKFVASEALAMVITAPTTGTNAPTVVTQTITEKGLGDIITAVGALGASAKNIYFIANRKTIAEYQALALAANYSINIFAGATVIPAPLADTVAIVGDLAAIRANFPNGDEVKFVFDEYSLAEEDLVKIVGRMMVGLGLVRDKAFTVINYSDGQ